IERAHDLADSEAAPQFALPLLRHLANRKGAYVLRGGFHSRSESRVEFNRCDLARRHADRVSRKPIEFARVLDERTIAALAHVIENRADHRLGFSEPRRPAFQQPADVFGLDYSDHSTILLSGYSTMPCPPACFSRGMISRTVDSSRMV